MAVTVNNITVDFTADPPLITFLQGANMDVTNIRNTLRQIEASDEGVMDEGSPDARGKIVKSSGNEAFDATTRNAITVTILPPFVCQFAAGAIPFKTSNGNLLADFVDSPGAIVQINNAVGATLFNSPDIEYSSFGGGVTIDVLNGTSGMVFPTGTPRQPSNNMTHAHMILEERGFEIFYIRGNLTITSGEHPHIYVGQGMAHSTIMIGGTADVHDAEFRDCMLMGTLNGAVEIERGHLMNVTNFLGSARQTMLQGTIALGGNAGTGPHGNSAHFLSCYSATPGTTTPTIDMGGDGYALAMRAYTGGVRITNKNGPEEVTIDLLSGQVVVDDTVTGGTILLRGTGKWTNRDEYAGGANVIDELVNSREVSELHKIAGLDFGNPVTITPTRRATSDGSIDITISGDGVTQSVLTRQEGQVAPNPGVFSTEFSAEFE